LRVKPETLPVADKFRAKCFFNFKTHFLYQKKIMAAKIFSTGSKATMNRAGFLGSLGLGAAGLALLNSLPVIAKGANTSDDVKPETNIKDAAKVGRSERSMPGKYPGAVVRVNNSQSVANGKIAADTLPAMLEAGICSLTGFKDPRDAWRQFVNPGEYIGLKVNPVAGKQLSTSVALTQALVQQLEKAGIHRKHLIIWDRREPQLEECGFTTYNFPGIRILGTERTDRNGNAYDADGKMFAEAMIDKDWFYWAKVNGEYDAETLPWMVNGGEYSYFSKIVTREVDKIINLPILKNAGSSVTLCLKNLAYGSITNTGRLHEKLWAETSAEACAFAPLRDKVVLNIVDGLIGCFQGGPGADPQFICEYKTLLFGSDPVAVDRIGYEIVLAKRIAENIQQKDSPRARTFLDMAEKLKLGVAQLDKIKLSEVTLG
jgi:uncharacterized protein (DUF362 family)